MIELNLANKLTLARILGVPVIVLLLYFPTKMTCLLAMLVFIIASLTDLFDGLVARRLGMVTNFGKFLDPLADKILVGSVLIMLVELGWVPAWVVIIIVARETTVTGLRAVASDMGMVLAADKYGKLKTVIQILALCPLLLHFEWFGFDPVGIGTFLLYIALVLTVFSGGNYLYKFYKNWLDEEREA
jgi:CDP-diacylglycerol--glycerol-3-phosphate 3-phosphatidyltransferase